MVLILDGNSDIGAHVWSHLRFDLFKAFVWVEKSKRDIVIVQHVLSYTILYKDQGRP